MAPRKKTVLVIPPNDPEAVLIYRLAQAMEVQVIRSAQPHGATLDAEPDVVELIRDGGWKRVVVVEMPGPKTEARIRRLGVELVIIDHHRYTDLDRAHHPKTGKLLLSSLEQFLALFRLTPAKLRTLGFHPRLVRGIALMDRGFIWALMEDGYGKADIKRVLAYQKELMAGVKDMGGEEKKNRIVDAAWKRKKRWKGYWIVEDGHDIGIRGRVSFLAALAFGKPTPVIIVEKKRGFVYVQESDHAVRLFEQFGGFTFGLDRNWGYRNMPRKPRVTLARVKRALVGWEN